MLFQLMTLAGHRYHVLDGGKCDQNSAKPAISSENIIFWEGSYPLPRPFLRFKGYPIPIPHLSPSPDQAFWNLDPPLHHAKIPARSTPPLITSVSFLPVCTARLKTLPFFIVHPSTLKYLQTDLCHFLHMSA